MADEAQIEMISDQISDLLVGLNLDEVTGILKIQLTMLIAQASDDAADATEFLEEIYDDMEEMIKRYPFGTDGEDAAEIEEEAAH